MSGQDPFLATPEETAERLCAIEAMLQRDFEVDVVERTMRYLCGELALDEWLDDRLLNSYVVGSFARCIIPAHTQLDDLDKRLIDICLAANQFRAVLDAVYTGPATQVACDYALDHGFDVTSLCRYCYDSIDHYGVDTEGRAMPLGAWLLRYLPDQFDAMCAMIDARIRKHEAIFAQRDMASGGSSSYALFYSPLVRLLLAATPPLYDLAWKLTQSAPDTGIGQAQLTALLVKADYARSAAWGLHIAGPESPASQEGRACVLGALLRMNPSAHIDLALETLRTPLEGKPRFYHPHVIALAGLYTYDPERFHPLLEEACASKDFELCHYAIEVVTERLPFDQGRPLLQRCVAKGNLQVALRVLRFILLEHEWEGREAYVASLLAHNSKKIREYVGFLLDLRGTLHADDLVAALHHPKTDVRLLAVKLLGRLGDEQAHALLRARLVVEQDATVQEAIAAIVGIAEHPLHNQDEMLARIAAFSAEAEAGLSGLEAAQLEHLASLTAYSPEWPAFYWQNGEPVLQPVLMYLLYEQIQSKHMHPVLALQRAQALVHRELSGEAALQLHSRIYYASLSSQDDHCAMTVATALGDDRLIQPTLRAIVNNSFRGADSRARCVWLIEALGALDSDAALNAVYDVSAGTHFRSSRTTQTAATKALDTAAIRRGMTPIELLDSITPRLGLDERGQRVFDYGPRQFTAQLSTGGELRLHDDAGQLIAGLPSPRASDDAVKAEAAQNAWQALWVSVATELKRQTRRVFEEYRSVYSRHAQQWLRLLLGHPLLRTFAVNLIWVYFPPDKIDDVHAFRALENGTLTDVNGHPLELPADALVRRAFRRHLKDDEYEAWMRHHSDYHLKPPFTQFE